MRSRIRAASGEVFRRARGVKNTQGILQPVAAFSGTPLSGDAPLEVVFTDSSTNTPIAWLWEKNDGSGWVNFSGTPTVKNPTEEFEEGIWSVRLTASNTGGSDDETKTNYVESEAAPSYVGPLDLVPGAVAAYGVRALSAAWLGQNVFRLKRNSDNAEMDFAADVVTGDVSVITIALWLGVATGYLVTQYDQSGNGRNSIPSPDSTVYSLAANGKPRFDDLGSATVPIATSFVLLLVGTDIGISANQGADYLNIGLGWVESLDPFVEYSNGSDYVVWSSATETNTDIQLFQFSLSGTTPDAFIDGVDFDLTVNDGTPFALPAMGASAFSSQSAGCQEEILWNSGDVSAAAANTASYFGIP